MVNMRPWILTLSSKFLENHDYQEPEYLNSDKFILDWNKAYLTGKTNWSVRVLSAHHPLKELPKDFVNFHSDSILSYSSGLECSYALAKGTPIHLVHPPATEFAKLGEYFSQTYQATGIESYKWETNSALSESSFNSYAIYKAALSLVLNGSCAGIFVTCPTEYDAGCRISVETGIPLFATFSASSLANQIQSSFSNNPEYSWILKGWTSRIQSLLKISKGIVFTDAYSMGKAYEFANQLWNESIFADYQSLLSGMQLYADHKIAISNARYEEFSIEDRKKSIAIAKEIEQTLKDASISYSSHHLNSNHFALVYSPLDLTEIEKKASVGFDNHQMAITRQKILNTPSLNGKVFARASKIIYVQAIDFVGLERFLAAFSKVKGAHLLLIDEHLTENKLDTKSLIKKMQLENKAILLSSKATSIERTQMQSVCDIIMLPGSTKIHSEQFLIPFSAFSLASKNSSTFLPAILSSGQIPHFASETLVSIDGGTSSVENYSRYLQEALENPKTSRKLISNTHYVLNEILSAKFSSSIVENVTNFFSKSVMD